MFMKLLPQGAVSGCSHDRVDALMDTVASAAHRQSDTCKNKCQRRMPSWRHWYVPAVRDSGAHHDGALAPVTW